MRVGAQAEGLRDLFARVERLGFRNSGSRAEP
jgi:hypothetical protein